MAKRIPERIAGLVTIAAAPDFTEDGFWASFNADTRKFLAQEGLVNIPSDYGDPYPITKRLIEDGRLHLVLRNRCICPFPRDFCKVMRMRRFPLTWLNAFLRLPRAMIFNCACSREGITVFHLPELWP